MQPWFMQRGYPEKRFDNEMRKGAVAKEKVLKRDKWYPIYGFISLNLKTTKANNPKTSLLVACECLS